MASKEGFANTIAEHDGRLNHASMTACEKYGMTWGCDTDCPTLRDGNCELQEAETKELYQEVLKEREDG